MNPVQPRGICPTCQFSRGRTQGQITIICTREWSQQCQDHFWTWPASMLLPLPRHSQGIRPGIAYWPGWMQVPCFGGQTLPDGFRDNESSRDVLLESQGCLLRTCCICSNKSRGTGGIHSTECIFIHQKNVCPREPMNRPVSTVCRCSSFNFTLAFQTPSPHPDTPHANKIPLSGIGWTVPSDYCYSGAGQCPLRSNAEFSCRCFSPIKTSRSVCFLYGGRGWEKIEEPHSIAQASWAISNSEWKEIMNQIIGNGNRATKMTS